MKRRKFLLISAGILLMSGIASAEVTNEDLLNEIKALKQKVEQQERRIGELEGRQSGGDGQQFAQIGEANGLEISIGTTFVAQGTDNANGAAISGKGEDATDGSYSMDIGIEREFEDCGRAFAHVESGDGAGVEDELQVFSNVNRDSGDTDNSVSVTEVYYEHYFKSVPLSLMTGKIDGTVLVDSNEYANDETAQFLGRIFRNSPVIEFPDNTAGFRLAANPSDFFDAAFLVMDADTDWEDIADEVFLACQLNFKPSIFSRNGNYRFIGWRNDSEHTKWADVNSTQNSSCGFGVSFDQELSDRLGAFLRYGRQDPDVFLNGQAFSLEQAWSLGAQLKGSLWNREDDILGLAVGQAVPSDEYKKAGANLSAKNEGHLEAYYNYKVNDHLTLTPDLQFIWNPYGDDAVNGKEEIAVIGMKGQLDF